MFTPPNHHSTTFKDMKIRKLGNRQIAKPAPESIGNPKEAAKLT